MRPAYVDLVDLFLTQAERCGMTFYFGIYDSGRYWHEGKPEREVELNLRFTEEVARKYAARKAFGGWYMIHEIHEHDEGVTRLIERLARHVKGLKDVPVLMSPYVRGRKQFADNPITPEEHERQWDMIFAHALRFRRHRRLPGRAGGIRRAAHLPGDQQPPGAQARPAPLVEHRDLRARHADQLPADQLVEPALQDRGGARPRAWRS